MLQMLRRTEMVFPCLSRVITPKGTAGLVIRTFGYDGLTWCIVQHGASGPFVKYRRAALKLAPKGTLEGIAEDPFPYFRPRFSEARA